MTPPNDGGTERIVIDATLMVSPATDTSLALLLDPGLLTITARLHDDDAAAPTALTFRAARDTDPDARIEMPVPAAGGSGRTTLAGGLYACTLHTTAQAPADANLADIAHQVQFVDLRMTLAPAQ
jgi:hypothetical protein